MRRLMPLLMLILCLPISTWYCAASSFEISPSKPEQGDTLSIVINATPGEEIPVSLEYSGRADVSDGKYRIDLNDVSIPQKPNSVYARASGVTNLRVAVKHPILGWISLNKDASNGVVTLSQSNIPSGTYDIQIKGDALPGEASIDLRFTAEITLTMDSQGSYSYSYDTDGIPPGTFVVDVDGVEKTITLSSRSKENSQGSVNHNPKAAFTFSGELVAGREIVFDGSGSKPVYGEITGYHWSFGDGKTGEGVQVSHFYDEPGEHVVRLEVTNSVGLKDSKSMNINILEKPNVPPVAKPGANRKCLTIQELDFDSDSYDPDGAIVSYLWDFDDGSIGTGRNVVHSYMEPGTYYVNHTVVDDSGASVTGFVKVIVEEPDAGRMGVKEIPVNATSYQSFDDLGIVIRVTGNGTRLILFKYEGNPYPDTELPNYQVGAILDLGVGNPDDIEWPIFIEVAYNGSLVSELIEPSLGLSYYHDDGWERCSRTGVYTDRDVAWANLTREELSGSPLTVSIVPPLPFFTYTGLELQHDTVEEGETASLEFTVSNNGEKNGNLVSIVYMDDTPIDSNTLHLEQGETQRHRIRFNVSERGEHLIRVDDMETGLTVVPPTLPDLVCNVSPIGEVVENEKVDMHHTVTNAGNRTAVGFVTKLYVNGLTAYSSRVEELGPGETQTNVYTWIASKADEYEVQYSVDTSSVVDELDEDNNTSEALIEVKAPLNMTYVVTAVLLVAFSLAAAYWYRSRS